MGSDLASYQLLAGHGTDVEAGLRGVLELVDRNPVDCAHIPFLNPDVFCLGFDLELVADVHAGAVFEGHVQSVKVDAEKMETEHLVDMAEQKVHPLPMCVCVCVYTEVVSISRE